MIKFCFPAALAALTLTSTLFGGQYLEEPAEVIEERKELQSWLIDTRVSYTGDGDFANEALGSVDSISYGTSVVYAAKLQENLQLRIGGAFSGFEFGSSDAPLPTRLQSVGGRFGLEYLVRDVPVAMIGFRPAFSYAGNEFDSDAFHYQINAAVAFQITPSLFGTIGVSYDDLRRNPFWPLAGLVWMINDDVRLMLIPPQPRLVVKINEQLDWQIGASFDGGAYRTGDDVEGVRDTTLEYYEMRAITGVEYSPTDTVSIRLEAGYAFYRRFEYDSLNERYRVDPAPYFGANVKLRF